MTQKNIVFVFLYSFYISLIYIFSTFVRKLVFQIKKAIFKQNIFLIMNLKERGITVGDLLILLIIVITSATLIKSFSKDKKTTLIYSSQEQIIYKENYYQKLI